MTLFALVVVGYIAGKLGYLGGDFDRQLSRLVINITCPALILSSAMSGTLPDRRYILPLLGISVITYLILTGAALFLPRYMTTRQEDEGAVGFAIMFGNVGFMGYPVVASIFGHQAVFYAAVLNVVNTLAVFTIGTILITGKSDVEGKHFQKKVLYSTPMFGQPHRLSHHHHAPVDRPPVDVLSVPCHRLLRDRSQYQHRSHRHACSHLRHHSLSAS